MISFVKGKTDCQTLSRGVVEDASPGQQMRALEHQRRGTAIALESAPRLPFEAHQDVEQCGFSATGRAVENNATDPIRLDRSA